MSTSKPAKDCIPGTYLSKKGRVIRVIAEIDVDEDWPPRVWPRYMDRQEIPWTCTMENGVVLKGWLPPDYPLVPHEVEEVEETDIPVSGREEMDKIISVVKRFSEGVGRGKILSETGISVGAWNESIKDLLSQGVVTKTGRKRGTKYHLA